MSETASIATILGDDRLLSPGEAAETLNRAPKTLAQWRSQGRGPRWRKIEGRVAYRIGDLRAFITASTGEG